jgi:anti-sigma B factor antagonist
LEALRVETAQNEGLFTVRPIGELDATGVGRLNDAIHLAEARGDPIQIDLRFLSFADSTGISAIYSAHRRARTSGRRLTVVPGPEQIHRVFEMTGLIDEIDFTDRDEPMEQSE